MNVSEQHCTCLLKNTIQMYLLEIILNIPKDLSKLEMQDQEELERELKHFNCGKMKNEL